MRDICFLTYSTYGSGSDSAMRMSRMHMHGSCMPLDATLDTVTAAASAEPSLAIAAAPAPRAGADAAPGGPVAGPGSVPAPAAVRQSTSGGVGLELRRQFGSIGSSAAAQLIS